jgi:hypothetical protein
MNERALVIEILEALDLPPSQYVVNGSGSMVLHGITSEQRGKAMGDLDIFCATRLWFELYETSLFRNGPWRCFTPNPDDRRERADPPWLSRVMHGLRVDVQFGWRIRHIGDFDINFWLHNQVMIDDRWPCLPLEFILDWKREVGRAKDTIDVRILEGVLSAET